MNSRCALGKQFAVKSYACLAMGSLHACLSAHVLAYMKIKSFLSNKTTGRHFFLALTL